MSFSSQNPHDPQHNPQGCQPNPQGQQPSYGGPTYGGANQPMQQPGQHQQPSYSGWAVVQRQSPSSRRVTSIGRT